MTRILLTRPPEGSRATILKLETLGYQVMLAPMTEIRQVSFSFPHASRSLIVTSQNAVRHGLSLLPDRERSVFAVGETTAAEARALGFSNVTVGGGDVKSLMPLLFDCGIELKRDFTYLAGEQISYDIAGALQKQDINCDTLTVYQAAAVEHLPPAVIDKLAAAEVAAVLFYSPRSAILFEELMADIGKPHWLERVDAFGLSERVTRQLISHWKTVNHPVKPTEDAMLNILEKTHPAPARGSLEKTVRL